MNRRRALLTVMGKKVGFPASLKNKLVLGFNFNETGGTRYDITNNANDAAESQPAYVLYGTGKVGNCVKDDNYSSNYLYAPVVNIPIDANWSASVWVNLASLTGWQVACGIGDGLTHYSWQIVQDGATHQWYFTISDDVKSVYSIPAVGINEWHNIYFCFDKSNTRIGISVDNGLITWLTGVNSINTNPAWKLYVLHSGGSGAGLSTNSLVDRLYIYGDLLTDFERGLDFNNGNPLESNNFYTTASHTIYAYGDSKTAGFNNAGWTGYPNWLTTRTLKYNESPDRNGAPGQGTWARKATIDSDLSVAVGTPEYILINLGVNDVPITVDNQPIFVSNLQYIVDAMHAKWPNAKIGLMRFWSASKLTVDLNTADNLVDSVIASRSLFCFTGPDERIFLENGDNGATYTIDGTHPNFAGYQLTASKWRDVISVL